MKETGRDRKTIVIMAGAIVLVLAIATAIIFGMANVKGQNEKSSSQVEETAPIAENESASESRDENASDESARADRERQSTSPEVDATSAVTTEIPEDNSVEEFARANESVATDMVVDAFGNGNLESYGSVALSDIPEYMREDSNWIYRLNRGKRPNAKYLDRRELTGVEDVSVFAATDEYALYTVVFDVEIPRSPEDVRSDGSIGDGSEWADKATIVALVGIDYDKQIIMYEELHVYWE